MPRVLNLNGEQHPIRVPIVGSGPEAFDADGHDAAMQYTDDEWQAYQDELDEYTDEELQKGYLRKNFIEAKYNFTQRMLEWGGVAGLEGVKILDVGCGIGGTSRYIAKKFPGAEVTGITISPEQQKRATTLAAERGIPNAKFELCDALDMK